jgi:aminopeptidase-like protein
LQEHLHSLPDQPEAIPYITSYYKAYWGFCLSHHQRQTLKKGNYRVKIDTELKNGSLSYGELIIPGQSSQEIFLSSYICHPSMANNELSGPCLLTYLARWIASLSERRYTYRIIFIPETIGSIMYISKHLDELKENVKAGFIVTCIGDERSYSYLPSRAGDTLSDKAALHALSHIDPNFKRYSYLNRGSDERQYCSPGVDLPMATIMRSKYGTYPEYHTSLDNLQLVTPKGLAGGYTALRLALEVIEKNITPVNTVVCEPHLSKRGLYPTLSTKSTGAIVSKMMNLLAYSDGKHSLLEIADIIGIPFWELYPIFETLRENRVLTVS